MGWYWDEQEKTAARGDSGPTCCWEKATEWQNTGVPVLLHPCITASPVNKGDWGWAERLPRALPSAWVPFCRANDSGGTVSVITAFANNPRTRGCTSGTKSLCPSVNSCNSHLKCYNCLSHQDFGICWWRVNCNHFCTGLLLLTASKQRHGRSSNSPCLIKLRTLKFLNFF